MLGCTSPIRNASLTILAGLEKRRELPSASLAWRYDIFVEYPPLTPPQQHNHPDRQHRNDHEYHEDGSVHLLLPSSAAGHTRTTRTRPFHNARAAPKFTRNHNSPHAPPRSYPVRTQPSPTHSSTFPAPSHAARKPLAFRVRTLIRWHHLADDVPNNGLFGGRLGSSLAGTSERSFSDPVDGSICSGPGRVPTRLVAASRDRCTLLPKLSTDP